MVNWRVEGKNVGGSIVLLTRIELGQQAAFETLGYLVSERRVYEGQTIELSLPRLGLVKLYTALTSLQMRTNLRDLFGRELSVNVSPEVLMNNLTGP